MRNVLWRLMISVAEILDRILLTVSDVDGYYLPSAGPADDRHDRKIERTRPMLRELIAARAGEPPGFVQG